MKKFTLSIFLVPWDKSFSTILQLQHATSKHSYFKKIVNRDQRLFPVWRCVQLYQVLISLSLPVINLKVMNVIVIRKKLIASMRLSFNIQKTYVWIFVENKTMLRFSYNSKPGQMTWLITRNQVTTLQIDIIQGNLEGYGKKWLTVGNLIWENLSTMQTKITYKKLAK